MGVTGECSTSLNLWRHLSNFNEARRPNATIFRHHQQLGLQIIQYTVESSFLFEKSSSEHTRT